MRARLRVAISALILCAPVSAFGAGHVNVATIDGSINPASSDYLQQAIADSESDGAEILVIELDTPGGLLSATKDIIQAMLNASVPVAVFVSPRGAWASSAGAYITIAANIAAMAPGTSIGAATPVSLGGAPSDEDEEKEKSAASQKAENLVSAFMESIAKERDRNVEWAVDAVRKAIAVSQDEALALGVIDVVADDLPDLLRQIDGREVKVRGATRTLQVADAEVRRIEMSTATRLLDVLASPDLLVILFLAGLVGLYIEANQPGLIIPGVAGAVCLILALIGMQIIPFSWVGLLLLLAGIGLFVAEVFVTSYGILFALGIACFLLGGSMIFERPEVSDLDVSFWSVLVPAVTALSTFAAIVVYAVGRTIRRRQTAGVDELIGMIGTATTALDKSGTVFVRGEYWKAFTDEPIQEGERVEVTRVEGLELRVRRVLRHA
ncbi:MAG: nodulation protein NfeD [Deltaproteobacteria bacterium]|nr:MAG: nodulation protein NfeD [Deltaproteobacteria bacterium]